MQEENHTVKIKNLKLADDGRLRVELVPMPAGENPRRTRQEYIDEQRRDTCRFWLTIASLIVSIISTAATSVVAIWTITSLP